MTQDKKLVIRCLLRKSPGRYFNSTGKPIEYPIYLDISDYSFDELFSVLANIKKEIETDFPEYSKVYFEHSYPEYEGGRSQFYLVGERLETDEEFKSSIDSENRILENKKLQYELLKKELGYLK